MQEQQQQAIPTEVYFVPPPINELNKNYYQQLSVPDNPVYQATKSYVSYNQFYRLDEADAPYECQMVTEKLKQSLKDINKSIYSKMVQYLASLSGQESLDNIKNQPQFIIKQQIIKFMQICQSVKRYETKKEVCAIMRKQTQLIKQRTNQILSQLQQVKQGFQNAALNEKSLMKPQ